MIKFTATIHKFEKQGEKTAMSREIAHLINKKQLTCDEFLAFLRRRG